MDVIASIAGSRCRSWTKEKAKIKAIRPMSLHLGYQRWNKESKFTCSSRPRFMNSTLQEFWLDTLKEESHHGCEGAFQHY